MEAPETIFVTPLGYGCLDEPCTERIFPSQIEYIRKDAFIEKVCEFIKERFSFEDSWHVEGETTILDKVIEDIKKYLEE